MRINYATLLGLSIWIVLIGAVTVYGAYIGSLNYANSHIVIGSLILAGDIIGALAAMQYFRLSKPLSTATASVRTGLNIYQ